MGLSDVLPCFTVSQELWKQEGTAMRAWCRAIMKKVEVFSSDVNSPKKQLRQACAFHGLLMSNTFAVGACTESPGRQLWTSQAPDKHLAIRALLGPLTTRSDDMQFRLESQM